jgi:hypothetical protein
MMAGLFTNVTAKSAFQALFAEKLAHKRLFLGKLQPIPEIFVKLLCDKAFSHCVALGCSFATFAPCKMLIADKILAYFIAKS